MLVRIANVKKEYKLGSTTVEALKGISLNFSEAEFTTVAGPSGCGKSTLLNLIGCMDKPTYGNVFHDETSIGELTDRQLTSMRLHRIGFIFQSFNLIPVLSVRQNIEFPLLLLGNMAAKERRMRIDELIEKVGLKDFSHHRSNELSGGQRQRVAVARALVTKPKIVLADEPTANLDSATGERIIELMKEMNRTLKTTFLFSTHDPAIMKHARRIVKLHDGLLEGEDKA